MITLSWYHKVSIPTAIAIGPSGHGDREWKEVCSVDTDETRIQNPFYVEHEMKCVCRRHGITITYDSTKPNQGKDKVHYANIDLTIPEGT